MRYFCGLKIGILVDDGFEQTELAETRKALGQAGAEARIVSPKDQWVRGWNSTEWGDELRVDVTPRPSSAIRFRRADRAGRYPGRGGDAHAAGCG
jgi:putative intracellular protease/amidase